MEKSKANSFVKRMITAVIMAPVVLLLLFFRCSFREFVLYDLRGSFGLGMGNLGS